ncbi:MAG TPA: hypothetical protein VMT71_08625 [Syntrophorhabdales bacterium]|nr:hypothetical protein [Syntrophorhabdales bacterium]
MPATYMAIMMESGEVRWRPKLNADISDSGPDDHRLIIEFEGDLEKMSWISNLSSGKVTVDFNLLVDCEPKLFDKAWLRHQGSRQAGVTAMGSHHIIEIHLE